VENFVADFDFFQFVDDTHSVIDASFLFSQVASDPNSGLNVRYQIQFTDPLVFAGIGQFTVSWHGQILGSLAGLPVGFALDDALPNQFSHCRVSYSPTQGLSVDLVTRDGAVTTNVVNHASLTWDAQPQWHFAFTGAGLGPNEQVIATVQNVHIVGQTAPYFQASLADRMSFQDFQDQFTFDLDTLDGHPENVQVTAESSNPTVIGPTNLTVTVVSPTRRQVTLNPLRGAHGNEVVTVTLDPGAGGPVTTTSYHHIILANVAPSISTLPSDLTVPQRVTRVIPFSIGSAHWPLSQVTVALAQIPSSIVTGNSVFVRPIDTGMTNWQLVLTPGLAQTGTGDVVVRVTDGSGDQAESKLTLTTAPANEPPTVLGAGSAISFNRDADQEQSVTEPGLRRD
jgi:hypothetical protein